jgi:hypothetical protein
MLKRLKHLVPIVLLLGWAFNILFWNSQPGINFAIFTGLCLAGGFYVLSHNNLRPAPKSRWLIIPFVFFAGMTFIRQEPLTVFLAYTGALFCLGVLTVTYLGGRWLEYSLADYFSKLFQLLESLITLGVVVLAHPEPAPIELEEKKKGLVRAIFDGVALSLPILICFGALLASADLVFQQFMAKLLSPLTAEGGATIVLQFCVLLMVACLLMGAILHAANRSGDEKLSGEGRPPRRPLLGFTEAGIVLGSVIILFLAFVIIQFRYFFGGEANIGATGFTYSEYARSGFNELVAVALLSLFLILGLSSITRRENEGQKRLYSGLSVVVVALVIVILVSAYQRLMLAMDWHGFSRLRLYPQVFMIWLGILLVAVVALEIFHRERSFALAAVLASLGFAISLSLFNVDASIVSHNVTRAVEGKHFNVNHLASLSNDAVPPLVAEYQNPALALEIHEGIGAALMCLRHSDTLSKASSADWRSFNLARWQAGRAFTEVEESLRGYGFDTGPYPDEVHTPGGVIYLCAN